jgi:hypothetical protein
MKTDVIGIITFRLLELTFALALVVSLIMYSFHAVPVQNQQIVLMIIGSLITINAGIAGYEWGSSRSSDRKTEILAGPDPTAKQTTETTTTQAITK